MALLEEDDMRTLLPVSLVLGGALALAAGCGEDAVPDGTIELRWTIGAGTQTCDEVMISNVKITLEEAEGGILGPFDASCSAGRPGPYALEVPPGSYYVVIDGYNQDERIYTGRSAARYTIESDATTSTDSVVLSPVPASVHLLWRFSDGRQ